MGQQAPIVPVGTYREARMANAGGLRRRRQMQMFDPPIVSRLG